VVVVAALALTFFYYPLAPRPQRTVEINMVARQWYFNATIAKSDDPNARATTILLPGSSANTTIVVTKGDLVIIHLSSGDVTHGFAIRGYPDVGPYEVTPGQTITIQFTAEQAGTFTFYCTVFCGPGHSGHEGTLIVMP